VLRYLTAGESHGKALVGIMEGIPAGIPLSESDFSEIMALRWAGYGRGARKKIETDRVEILSGTRNGITLGSPIALLIDNKSTSITKSITVPRPGHADLAGAIKFETYDLVNIRERASARETAMRVALSVPARKLISLLGVESIAMVRRIGRISASISDKISIADMKVCLREHGRAFLSYDKKAIKKWISLIDNAVVTGDTLGGEAEIWFEGLPAGLGSHVHWDRRLDAKIAGALMSIPAVKAVEMGQGIDRSREIGRKAHDEIQYSDERGYWRPTNFSGGLEGGMTNGEKLIFRCFMKPLPGNINGFSIELGTHETKPLSENRSDTVAVAAMAIVAESVAAIEIAGCFLEKFGGDSFYELQTAMDRYKKHAKKM